ncbi:hypothetical protein [Stenotrophomonas rhizophila]|uniref:hypothetical protein n=1 Tax=Stenotrophomonas rhizophila TaxID=216778 RepID=UPI00112F6C49|nr:hypothetical protein [Stenotrophomonas rhizophila]
MEWTNWLTLGIAVLGATLGVFNAVWLIRKDTVRLRIRYTSMYIVQRDEWIGGLEAVNTGYIAVSISEVAFKRGRFARQRLIITNDYMRSVSLPHRLEPRTSMTMSHSPDVLRQLQAEGYTHGLVTTVCGVTAVTRLRTRKK